MYCPKCNHWNAPGYLYCITCGTRLTHVEQEIPPVLTEIQQLKDLLNQNYATLHKIDERLSALEKEIKSAAAQEPAAVSPAPPKAGPTEEIAAEVAKPQPAPIVEKWEPPVPTTPVEKPERPPGEWEQILGGNWLARIGVFALLIGIAFFLKYAFDKNWISPVIRVLMGGVFGLLLLGGGHLWRKKYPVMTRVLTGGGVGVMFLSVFAAFSVYSLIPFLPAIILVLVICAISVFFALRYDSMALAILGVIGAFLAPLLVGISGSHAVNHGTAIPIYLIIVDIGVLYVSTFRNWRWFTVLSFLSSALIFQIAYEKYHNDIGIATEEVFLTLLFLIFVGTTILFNVIRRKAANELDWMLMLFNAVYYFGVSYYIMWGSLRDWMGLFSLLVALFYGGLYYLIRRRGTENRPLSLFALGLALIFLTIAIPVQIGDRAWTTIIWAADGAIVIWLSFRTKMALLRANGYIVFVLTAIRLLFYDIELPAGNYFPVFNQRGLAFLVCIAIVYLAGYILRHYKDMQTESEKNAWSVYPLFLIAANTLTMWFIGVEISTYIDLVNASVPTWPLLFLIGLGVVTTLQHLIWRRRAETYDVILLIANAIFYAVISAVVWVTFRGWIGGLYFLLAFVYFGLYWGTRKRTEGNLRLAPIAISIGVLYFTAAIPVQIGNYPWVSIAWAGEFITLMWVAGAIRLPLLRYFGYMTFVIMAIRLVFIDTFVKIPNFQPVINLRFLAFVTGILAAYTGAWLLRHDRDREPGWKTPASTLWIFANFLTLWLLSFEIWNFFDYRALNGMASSAAQNAQNLSLTGIWLVYAVVLLVVGIARRSRAVRLGGLALMALSILKVFMYDVFKLETVYRIIAFVGLGILLLVGGYLYQRYSSRIKDFLTK
jgi:uncharacterized membrane protein